MAFLPRAAFGFTVSAAADFVEARLAAVLRVAAGFASFTTVSAFFAGALVFRTGFTGSSMSSSSADSSAGAADACEVRVRLAGTGAGAGAGSASVVDAADCLVVRRGGIVGLSMSIPTLRLYSPRKIDDVE